MIWSYNCDRVLIRVIVTGDDNQTQFIVNLNAIPALCWLLDHQKKNIRKEACWTLSNITAGK